MTDPTDPNHQFLTTLANLGIASHRLDQIRDAARLHRQQLIGSSELYAVIEADSPATPAVPAPATGRAAVLVLVLCSLIAALAYPTGPPCSGRQPTSSAAWTTTRTATTTATTATATPGTAG